MYTGNLYGGILKKVDTGVCFIKLHDKILAPVLGT